MIRVALGSDHAAWVTKEQLKTFLETQGYVVLDEGTHSADSVDYPDIAQRVCSRYRRREADFGILLCGTGIGMSITANKIPSIRAALCLFPEMAELARRHNDANVLVLGGRLMGPTLIQWTVQRFLETQFEAGRHQTRVDKITNIEQKAEFERESRI